MEKKAQIQIYCDKKSHSLGDLFGIFFEDLNYAADGGLYAEMIQNRSFEYDRMDNERFHPLYAWEGIERGTSLTRYHVDSISPLHSNNPHYLVLEVLTSGQGGGIRNEGFQQGIFLEAGKEYHFSCYYRSKTTEAEIKVQLESKDNSFCYDSQRLTMKTDGNWHKAVLTLVPEFNDKNARLAILSPKPLQVDLDMISLFPVDTFGRRENGLRKDLATLLKDLKPKFMRFPGGCLIHMGSLEPDARNSIYRWKSTIGPIEKRPPRKNNAWNYHQTYGLGFYEFFCLCEDIGTEPLPVISAGYDPHNLRIAPLEDMQPWIDDALDLIEFANGETTTEWGKIRADMGHPQPFHLKYLAIGNEEVGEEYFLRYRIIAERVREKYPKINLITSGGPGAGGNQFELGWKTARETGASFVDEHYYQAPEWFISNVNRYKEYPDDGPRAFLGEYASGGQTWYHALSEAVYMTGIERSPGIGLACYAPLLAHSEYAVWKPDLIWFDKCKAYGTASYYVQKLFMCNQGDCELPLTTEGMEQPYTPDPLLCGEIAFHTGEGEVSVCDLKVTCLDTMQDKEYASFILNKKNPDIKFPFINSSRYSVTFRAMRKGGTLSGDLNGANGFSMDFAVRDNDNKMSWGINGWQRLNSIRSIIKGRSSSLADDFVSVSPNEWQDYQLKIDGTRINTYINGKVSACAQMVFPHPDKLYCCSSIESLSGDIILKAVNINNSGIEAEILLHGNEKEIMGATLSKLAGYLPDAENTFSEPEFIYPREEEIEINQIPFTYYFPPLSVSVFRFHTKE